MLADSAIGSVPIVGTRFANGLSVCIPAFNEELTIQQAVVDADAIIEQTSMPGEILAVDDGSTDRTWQTLCDMQKKLPRLKLRRHETNQGIAATFGELYQWAGKELVFLNSADGQWKMSALLQLLPLADKHDIVIARRPVKHYSLGRHMVSWLFNALPIIFFATRTYDAGSVKLVRRAIYDDIPILSRGVFGEAERIIRAQRRGLRIGVRDIEHFPRTSGKALGAKPYLVIEAIIDFFRCWLDIVILRRK